MKLPLLISPTNYAEYLTLKRRYESDLKRESIRSVSLEFDIDEPIKTCVMALALLGCNPTWSCCGFDYEGQPIHKSHDYGRAYFGMESNEKSARAIDRFFASNTFLRDTWKIAASNNDGILTVWLSTEFVRAGQWNTKDSIHYSELAITRIGYLEMFLLQLKDEMSDSFVLKDHNALYRRRFKFWQYPAKESWLITKSALRDRVVLMYH